MAPASTLHHPQDQHFLRTGAESDTVDGHLNHPGERTSGPAPADEWWPLPENTDAIREMMRQMSRFSLLMLRIDPPSAAKASRELIRTLENLLPKLFAPLDGHWFSWGEDGFGVLLPDMDPAAAKSPGSALQHQLAQAHVETISIGITEFPFYTFDYDHTLRNAAKALDHGAFFGPNACIVFDSVSLNISGDRYYQADDLDGAIIEYQLALDLDNTNINARNSLGVCLAQKGQYEIARQVFESICASHPDDAMALFNLGRLELNQQHPDRALDLFKKAHAADHHTFDIPYQLGKFYFENNQPELALDYLETAKTLRDDYGPLYSLIGRCHARLGHINVAIAACKQAVKFNPNDAAALSELGTLYAERGENLDICRTFCRQSVLIDPENGNYRRRLADLYFKFQQWDDALAEYEKTAALGGDVGDRIELIRRRIASSAEMDERIRCA